MELVPNSSVGAIITILKHLRLLNVAFEEENRHKVFHAFPTLPKELRLQIWKPSARRERLLEVLVHRSKHYDVPEDFHTEDGICAFVKGHQVLSKL